MKAGLDGADRDPEGVRDFRQRKLEEVVVDEDGPVVDRQLAQAPVECVTVRQLTTRIRCGPIMVGQEPDARLVAASAARFIPAGIHQQAAQPCVQPLRFAQAWQVAPRPNQRVLDGVFGPAVIPEDEAGRRIQTIEPWCGECRKGFLIARRRGPDHVLVCHELLPGVPSEQSHGMAHGTPDWFTGVRSVRD